MYVLVQHTVGDPSTFFALAAASQIPAHLKLHHTFPTADGTHAVCVWEGPSVQAVRDFLEPAIGRLSRNEYFEVLNQEGIAMPPVPLTV